MLKNFLLSIFILVNFTTAHAIELVIGEETVPPGVVFIFEGAIKDQILPSSRHIDESETHVHIEARVNWAEKDIPEGTPAGGFVPYLYITAKVVNQTTGLSTFVDLLPHINLVDNFHYARNISLPGKISDLYSVTFTIAPPSHMDLGLHKDWVENYDKSLMDKQVFNYKDVNFEEIAKANRN